jgi:hypothetical protein
MTRSQRLLLQRVVNSDAFKVVPEASLYLLAFKPDDEDDMFNSGAFSTRESNGTNLVRSPI